MTGADLSGERSSTGTYGVSPDRRVIENKQSNRGRARLTFRVNAHTDARRRRIFNVGRVLVLNTPRRRRRRWRKRSRRRRRRKRRRRRFNVGRVLVLNTPPAWICLSSPPMSE